MAICYVSLSEFAAMKANGIQTIAMCNAFAEREKTFLFFFDDDGSNAGALSKNFRLHGNLNLVPVRRKRFPFKPRFFNLIHLTLSAIRVGEPIRFLFTREVFIAWFLTFMGRPFFLEHHLNLREPWHRHLLRWISGSRNLRAHVPISSSMVKTLGLEKCDPDKILILHDGVDLSLFDASRKKAIARIDLQLPPDRFIAGYCGQLYADKGAYFILELAAALPDVLFLLVGGQVPDLAPMKAAVLEKGLANVLLTGRVDHARVPGYLAACDCFLLPNTTNYYMSPLKLFEYMAADRPIIASDFPPFREVIEPGKTGLLARPNDRESFLAAIAALRREPALGGRLALAAREKVESEHSWISRVDSILARAKAGQIDRRNSN